MRCLLLTGAVLLVSLACQPAAAPRPAAPTPAVVATAAAPSAPIAAAAPAAPVAASAPALESVRVGILNNSADVPFFLAEERGYLREAGIEMSTQVFNGAQQMIAPLGADQLDAGGGAPGPGLFNAIQRGVSVRIVGDRVRMIAGSRFNCLVARKALLDSGALTSVADVRGRVFAENVPNVATTYVFDRELRRVGLGMQDVSTVVLPFPDMLSALGNAAMDLGFVAEPFITLAEERGVGQCWLPIGDLLPDFQLAVVLYGPTFAEQRAEAARRLMVAYLRASRDYVRAFFGDGAGREPILQVLARITGSQDTALLSRQAPFWLDPNGQVNADSLRDLQRWYRERGDLQAEADLNRVIDPTFAEFAVAQLGPFRAP